MSVSYSTTLGRLIQEFSLETVYLPENGTNIQIASVDINRPGLQLSGFSELFDTNRVQVMGRSEFAFLERFNTQELHDCIDKFFSLKPPVVIVTRSSEVPSVIMELAKEHNVALLRTKDASSEFMSGLISFLNVELAPRVTRHGVLVEVYGEGILLLGESGVGKSETAIELVKRGHRLIADDAVEIRRVSNKTLVGTSPENIRHFVELRGVGIINARKIFGIGSVKITEKIDMVIQLEPWSNEKVYDRMGLDNEYLDILGINISATTIPVKPGRNLAIIIEVAAMNNRQKKMGYNAAHELLRRLGMMEPEQDDINVDWETF